MKERLPKIATLLATSALNLEVQAAQIPVSQDGWINFNQENVKDGGTGNKLNLATPNPTAAFQYTRLAVFGFDTSEVDLSNVQSVVFSATLSDDVIDNYAGTNLRFFLIANSLVDQFEETSLTPATAPGVTNGNLGTGNQITGAIIGDVILSETPASEQISLRFSAAAVADLTLDDNDFVTIVAQNLDPNNAGFNDSIGLGFQSKESGNGATLSTSSDFISSTTVDEDGYIDFGDGTPIDGGVGERLSIATPNPSAAFQYTRQAYFGFDLSEVDLNGIGAATFRAQLAADIVGYQGALVRFYLVNNTLDDQFDETTLIDTNAPGLTPGDVLAAQQVDGSVLGEVVIRPGTNPLIGVDFPQEAFADLNNDTNDFVTIVAEVRTQANAGYGDFTGIGFASKELDDATPATLLFGRALIDGGSYGDYISSFGLAGTDAEPTTDFDGDGQPNGVEFALGLTDASSASSFPLIVSREIEVAGIDTTVLITTLPVDTTEDPEDPAGGRLGLINPTLGVSIAIEGSADLENFDREVFEVTGVDFSAFPAAPEGFEYRAFRLGPGATGDSSASRWISFDLPGKSESDGPSCGFASARFNDCNHPDRK